MNFLIVLFFFYFEQSAINNLTTPNMGNSAGAPTRSGKTINNLI